MGVEHSITDEKSVENMWVLMKLGTGFDGFWMIWERFTWHVFGC